MSDLKDELIHEIGGMILSDGKINAAEWDGLTLVGKFASGSAGLHGFRYFGEGDFEARNPGRAGDIVKKLRVLREEMAKETGAEWHQCLIQIWKPGPQIKVQFEYDDPERWKPRISGLDMSEHANSIRPPLT